MDDKLQAIETKLDRILAILDAKELKKLQDKDRIKSKRDEEAVADAKRRGVIVVDRLMARLIPIAGCPTKSGRTSAWSLTMRSTSCAGW